MQKVTVFAASGRQGLAQVRQLTKAGYAVRAVSRRADPFYGEIFPHTDIMAADLDAPDDIARAVAGVDAVFMNCPLMSSDQNNARIAAVGRAAMEDGVEHMVLHIPTWLPDEPVGQPGYDMARENAATMLRAFPDATVLGGVLFMDNLLTDWAFPNIVEKGLYSYPHNPELAANWISLDDVARLMIETLERPELKGEVFSIGGPERLKPQDVADILTEVLGKKIRYWPMTPRDYGAVLASSFGLSGAAHDATTRVFEDFYIFNNFSPHRPFCVDFDAVQAKLPIKLENFRDWARRQDWTMSEKPRPPAG